MFRTMKGLWTLLCKGAQRTGYEAAVLAAAASLFASCGGSGGDGGPPAQTTGFELRLNGGSIPVRQNSSGLLRVRIERQSDSSGPIELTLANPPAGVRASTIVVEPHEDEAWLPLRFAADLPLGALGAVIAGSSGATTSTANLQLDVQAAQPSSGQLIQAALAAGQIDLGTSLLYRAYVAFGSAKLPEAFVGAGAAEEDIALFVEIEDQRQNLPQAILDQLQPFLVRPDDPQSVFNVGQPTAGARSTAATAAQPSPRARPMAAAAAFAEQCPGGRREWISLRSTQHPVRAFALCLGTLRDDSTARFDLLKVIAVVDKAFGLMTENMGPAKPDLWGDDAIDVYVVPPNADAPREQGDYVLEGVGAPRGVAFSQPPYVGRTSSGYVMLPRWRMALDDHQLTVIHELFHVLQFAHNYRLGDYWFGEASATWSSFHFNRKADIDPADNKRLHEERFGGYQESKHGLLDSGTRANPYPPYYSYVWPLFMEQAGDASMIGAAWRRLASATTHEQATDALDFLLPFQDNFRKFALRNLNQQYLPGDPLPTAKRYVNLDAQFPDELAPKASVKSMVHEVTPGAKQALNLGRPIEPLSAVYFDVTPADARLKKVVFDLSALRSRGLDVDALVMIDGTWEAQPRDLNGQSELAFCLDDPKEALGNIVFIVSNHQKRVGSQASAELGVTGETTPCNTVWSGTASSELTGPGGKATVTANVIFEFDETAPPSPIQSFRLRSGNWTFHATQQVSGSCTITSRGSGSMIRRPAVDLGVPGSTFAVLNIVPNLVPANPAPASYSGTGVTASEVRETGCNGDELTSQTAVGWFSIVDANVFFVSDDGNKIEGSSTSDLGGGTTVRYRWSFTRSRD